MIEAIKIGIAICIAIDIEIGSGTVIVIAIEIGIAPTALTTVGFCCVSQHLISTIQKIKL